MILKRYFVKLCNWEYWPFHILYGPIYFYWFWLCIKARSFFFFNAANPSIQYGGFLMERKSEIYKLLPQHLYPVTLLCNKHDCFSSVVKAFHQKQFAFPVIAKPDVGLRGMGVAILQNLDELKQYHDKSKVAYLLQAYIRYEKEVGVFYYRMPGEANGKISGVVSKELLKLKGDGQNTIRQLLLKNKRFLLQMKALQLQYGNELNSVLAAGEERLLVPFGNHSRGAKFVDVTATTSERLTATINNICTNIPGFYFGRLDIKFDNWTDLFNGKNFSIIEVNGAGSEPAHIYDPSHSIWFGWAEIIKHLNILYRISSINKKRKNISYLTVKEGLQMLRDNSAHLKRIA